MAEVPHAAGEGPALLILSALKGELEPARRAAGAQERVEVPAPARLFLCPGAPEVWLGWSGMGRGPTEALLRALPGRPRHLLHLGVAGALDPTLQAGDARWLKEIQGPEGRYTCPPDPSLRALLPELPEAGALTVEKVAGAPAEKRALGKRFPELALVEMECAWVVPLARELGCSLSCLRVVIDAVDADLPDLSASLDVVGEPRPLAFAGSLLRRPKSLAGLPRLARAFARAQGVLSESVARVLAARNTFAIS